AAAASFPRPAGPNTTPRRNTMTNENSITGHDLAARLLRSAVAVREYAALTVERLKAADDALDAAASARADSFTADELAALARCVADMRAKGFSQISNPIGPPVLLGTLAVKIDALYTARKEDQ